MIELSDRCVEDLEEKILIKNNKIQNITNDNINDNENDKCNCDNDNIKNNKVENMIDVFQKYIKYKTKYIEMKKEMNV